MAQVPSPDGNLWAAPVVAAGAEDPTQDSALANAPAGGEYEGLPTFEGADFTAKPHGLPDSEVVPETGLATAVGTGPPLVFDPKS